MHYVVSGGAGYIGGHLVDHLISKGHEVIAVDLPSAAGRANPRAKFVKHDLRKPISLGIGAEGPIVYHMAANPDVRSSMKNIREHFESDVLAALNVMEMARQLDAQLVVFASSAAVYGEAPTPTPEDAPARPISYHGLYKLMAEEIVSFYSRSYGIRSVIARMANVVGGRMTHGVIVDFLSKLRDGGGELEILGDGKQRRSFLYMGDLLSAFDALEEGPAEGIYNVGNDDWLTIEDVAGLVSAKMGVRPKLKYNRCVLDIKEKLGDRGWAGDVRAVLLDTSKLKKLGWRPSMGSSEAVGRALEELMGAPTSAP